MWIVFKFFPDKEQLDTAVLVGHDGTLYFKLVDLLKILYTGQSPFRVCKKYFHGRVIGRSVKEVCGIPSSSPTTRVVTFEEGLYVLRCLGPIGIRLSTYLEDVLQNGRVTHVKTVYGGLTYSTNPKRATVYRIVYKYENLPRIIPIAYLLETARTKFVESYRRLVPRRLLDERQTLGPQKPDEAMRE